MNRLAGETSPYLLQHASNPVDWRPWGEEAFAEARRLDRPVLLSVGYSTCHWCHVMAHESFEDPVTAALMNRWFVNVKVDREERPDIDSVYMAAVQAMTGHGGWPMTVFLEPGGGPLYAGTYFPPEDTHGRPGFRRVLEAVHRAWEDNRAGALAAAERVATHLRESQPPAGEAEAPDPAAAVARLQTAFDHYHGGFGVAPKFPGATTLEFLLAQSVTAADASAGHARMMALQTLSAMAGGGIYDHLGGGFARYSVDREWLVPHFEKMLYDNAQLARVYLHAWQVTGEPDFLRVTRETLDFLLREMRDPAGGFYAAFDADSEGIEGKFYVWTTGETAALFGADAPFFDEVFGVTAPGNFTDPHHPELTGRNVLSRHAPLDRVAAKFGLTTAEAEAKASGLAQRAFESRRLRVPPGLDTKVLASWNGLALAAFAEAARVLDEPGYREAAEANAAFVRSQLWSGGRLSHAWAAGQTGNADLVEDYALYGLGLVELFKLTGELAHLEWARELLEAALARFRDPEGGFFQTPGDGEELLFRHRPVFDEAAPAGGPAAALLAGWLARYYNRPDWDEAARAALRPAHGGMEAAPGGFGTAWQAASLLAAPSRELVIMGSSAARAPFERVAAKRFDPWLVVAPSGGGGWLPLFEGREHAMPPAAYLCEAMVCQAPLREPAALDAALAALPSYR